MGLIVIMIVGLIFLALFIKDHFWSIIGIGITFFILYEALRLTHSL